MTDVSIRAVQPQDVEHVARHMRRADRRELAALGSTPLDALRASVQCSHAAWTATVGEEPAAIGGVAALSLLTGLGAPWLLGTHLLDKHARVLVRHAPRYIASMHELYPVLRNVVHVSNTRSTRWLQSLGFVLHPPQPLPPHGELFHVFEKRA